MPTIFYAWQSTTPNKTNRGFIKGALKTAIRNVNTRFRLSEPLTIDMDTSNIPGTPPIVDTILEKIDSCGAIVADVTAVGESFTDDEKKRCLIPNPNVMIEFGYARSKKSLQQIVLVANEYYGGFEHLPFDLAHLRYPTTYVLRGDESPDEKKAQKQLLTRQFEQHLTGMIDRGLLANVEGEYTGRPSYGGVSTFIDDRRLCELDDTGFEDGEQVDVVWRNGPQLFLRLIPARPRALTSLRELKSNVTSLPPLGLRNIPRGTWSMLNEWGGVSFVSPTGAGKYEAKLISQVFSDTGEIWGINQHLFREKSRGRIMPGGAIESVLEKGVRDYLVFARDRLGLEPPFFVIAGLDNIKGLKLAIGNREVSIPCVLETVSTSPIRIVDTGVDARYLLRPLYERLWDACDEEYRPQA